MAAGFFQSLCNYWFLSSSGDGSIDDPFVPVVSVEGIVDGNVVVDFTDMITELAQLHTDLIGNTLSRKTADGQVKGSAGKLHTITIAPTGSVVAGVLTVYDSLTETGTVLFSVSLPITTFAPFTVTFDGAFGTGLFCAFDATLANVQATFSYQ